MYTRIYVYTGLHVRHNCCYVQIISYAVHWTKFSTIHLTGATDKSCIILVSDSVQRPTSQQLPRLIIAPSSLSSFCSTCNAGGFGGGKLASEIFLHHRVYKNPCFFCRLSSLIAHRSKPLYVGCSLTKCVKIRLYRRKIEINYNY